MSKPNLGLFCVCCLALAGCALFRSNPLDEKRGAVVLVFDTRKAGNLNSLCRELSENGACATFFMSGQIRRGDALTLMDLQAAGHEFGLSGLRGTDPQLYVSMYGRQKYYQDEIVTQVLGAKGGGLNPRHFLLHIPPKAKPETLSLPAFIAAKGFAHVVDVLPDYVPQTPLAACKLKDPVVHAYTVTTNNFNRALIATLAQRNEILVVAPNRQALPALLGEVRAQGVPFATLADLK